MRKIYWKVQVKWTKPSESDRIWVHVDSGAIFTPLKFDVPWEPTFPSFLGVMAPHILGVENLHFSMGFWGPRVDTQKLPYLKGNTEIPRPIIFAISMLWFSRASINTQHSWSSTCWTSKADPWKQATWPVDRRARSVGIWLVSRNHHHQKHKKKYFSVLKFLWCGFVGHIWSVVAQSAIEKNTLEIARCDSFNKNLPWLSPRTNVKPLNTSEKGGHAPNARLFIRKKSTSQVLHPQD